MSRKETLQVGVAVGGGFARAGRGGKKQEGGPPGLMPRVITAPRRAGRRVRTGWNPRRPAQSCEQHCCPGTQARLKHSTVGASG